MGKRHVATMWTLASLLGTSALAATTTVAGFDGGSNDGFMGNAFFEATGGNPGGVAHTPELIEFPSLRTGGIGEPSNPGFLGDYSGFTGITFSVDVKTVSMMTSSETRRRAPSA